ncbi:DUF835 domain-containing protein [Nanoarchaeota archaeon]
MGDLRNKLKKEESGLSLGASYLIKEKLSNKVHDVFKQKLEEGFNGLCITRTNPAFIKEQHGDIPVFWLSSHRNEDSKTISDIDSVLNKVSCFLKENNNTIVLFERIDYLFNMYGFDETLRFLYKLNDKVVTANSILLTHINPDILEPMQLAMIEQELHNLPKTSKDELELTDDLDEILNFVDAQKSMNKTVSFKDVTKKFNITKSTARRRIKRLHSLNLIDVKKNGRFKIVSLVTNHPE